ncbi:ABC transporter ATP-binding protein [Vaginisenegalia massiliensis]|uniref:ABC transporter ATP-binding protein n=1 Tax=Vaginisenegalia massiliensis TaxID=2058294 RepID=UPI000F53EA17|nr:ABC transporter ATP-binding protein [Vaginisenegalia massiliensis]
MLNALWKYIKQHPVVYAIVTLFSLASSLIALVPNLMIQRFVDAVVQETLSIDRLYQLLAIFIGSSLLLYLVDVTWVILLFGQAYKFQAEIRSKIFRRLLELRTPFYEQFRSGDLMTRMTNDIDSFGTTIGYGFMIIISNIAWAISLLAIMCIAISWQLTLVSVIPLIILCYAFYRLGMLYDKYFEDNREAVAQLSNEVLEVVDGVRVMRAYGNAELEQGQFRQKTQSVLDKANHLIIVGSSFSNLAKLMTGLSTAISLAFGGYLVSHHQLSVGQVVSFQIYIGILGNVIWGLSDLVAVYQEGKVSHQKIEDLMTSQDGLSRQGQSQLETIQRLEFRNYSFTYPTKTEPSLQSISFVLEQGQTLGIVGRTGAGKTSLIRQLLCQYPLSHEGAILINGQDISHYAFQALEQQIGYVPQEHILFSKSVRDNIRFGKANASEAEFEQAISLADFSKDITRMAHGLDTMIGEKGVAISGGQKQRVSMARALIRDPELLILDDSLSAVDAKTERAIIENIQTIRQEKMTIIISHRLSAVAHADLVLVMDQGQIKEAGRPDQLLASQGWYYQQYRQQTLADASQIEEGE